MPSFSYASARNRCPVCGSDKTCRSTTDGLHFCHYRREIDSASTPPYVYLKESSNGVWSLWVHQDDYGRGRGERDYATRSAPTPVARPPKAEGRKPGIYVYDLCEKAPPLTATRSHELAAHLGLPVSIARHWRHLANDTYNSEAWVIPEWGYDDAGTFGRVAWLLRYANSEKKVHGSPDIVSASKRGLILLDGWDQGGAIYLPEGASDTLALHALGLSAIGRPSSRGGHNTVARFLSEFPALDGREIIVLGENDQKTNALGKEQWEGRDGAHAFGQELARCAGRPVKVGLAPAGHKDVRAWFQAQHTPGLAPQLLGPELEAAVGELLRVYRPGPPSNVVPPASDGVVMGAVVRAVPVVAAGVPDTFPPAALATLTEQLRAARADGSLPMPPCSTEAEAAEEVRAARADHEHFPCPHCRPVILIEKASHSPAVIYVRCERWTCPGCRGWLTHREMVNAALHFHSAEEQQGLHELACTDRQWEALRRRIARAGGEYLRCRDGEDGPWWVVTDRPINGAEPIPAADALRGLRCLLDAWPGEHRPITTSHGWRLPREELSDRYERAGMAPTLTPEQVHEVAEAHGAAVRVFKRPGSTIQVGYLLVGAWTRDTAFACVSDLFDGRHLDDDFDAIRPLRRVRSLGPPDPSKSSLGIDLGLTG